MILHRLTRTDAVAPTAQVTTTTTEVILTAALLVGAVSVAATATGDLHLMAAVAVTGIALVCVAMALQKITLTAGATNRDW